MLKILLIPILTFAISGCYVTIGAGSKRVVTDTSCSVMKPMRCSRTDTAETLTQCKMHNAVYDSLCKKVAK